MSVQGRWLSPDVVLGKPADPQSWNRYTYVLDDPTNGTDPTGLLTVYVLGTGGSCGSLDNQPGSAFVNAVLTTFGEDAEHYRCLDWSAGMSGSDVALDYDPIYDGGGKLADLINNYTFADGESLNIVAHSHGGNVVKIASHSVMPTINNLITLGTPQNWFLPSINDDKVNNYCNVSSESDPIQFLGSSPYQIGNTLVNYFYALTGC